MFAIREAKKRAPKIRKLLLSWAIEALRSYPWRKMTTPYSIFVAEVLLKRTTSTAVNRIYKDFLGHYPSIKALAEADTKELEASLRSVGYQKLRAQEFREAATFIQAKFNGRMPKDMDKLLSIPNIGPYTAAAILSLSYGIRAPMVDSNVERILQRVFRNSMPNGSLSRVTREVADVLLPQEEHATFNLAMIDLGGVICRYRSSHCEECPLKKNCDSAH